MIIKIMEVLLSIDRVYKIIFSTTSKQKDQYDRIVNERNSVYYMKLFHINTG